MWPDLDQRGKISTDILYLLLFLTSYDMAKTPFLSHHDMAKIFALTAPSTDYPIRARPVPSHVLPLPFFLQPRLHRPKSIAMKVHLRAAYAQARSPGLSLYPNERSTTPSWALCTAVSLVLCYFSLQCVSQSTLSPLESPLSPHSHVQHCVLSMKRSVSRFFTASAPVIPSLLS